MIVSCKIKLATISKTLFFSYSEPFCWAACWCPRSNWALTCWVTSVPVSTNANAAYADATAGPAATTAVKYNHQHRQYHNHNNFESSFRKCNISFWSTCCCIRSRYALELLLFSFSGLPVQVEHWSAPELYDEALYMNQNFSNCLIASKFTSFLGFTSQT